MHNHHQIRTIGGWGGAYLNNICGGTYAPPQLAKKLWQPSPPALWQLSVLHILDPFNNASVSSGPSSSATVTPASNFETSSTVKSQEINSLWATLPGTE